MPHKQPKDYSSLFYCSAGGKFCNHSSEFLVCGGNKICRFVVILSRVMKRNIITLTNEIAEHIYEMMFHVA